MRRRPLTTLLALTLCPLAGCSGCGDEDLPPDGDALIARPPVSEATDPTPAPITPEPVALDWPRHTLRDGALGAPVRSALSYVLPGTCAQVEAVAEQPVPRVSPDLSGPVSAQAIWISTPALLDAWLEQLTAEWGATTARWLAADALEQARALVAKEAPYGIAAHIVELPVVREEATISATCGEATQDAWRARCGDGVITARTLGQRALVLIPSRTATLMPWDLTNLYAPVRSPTPNLRVFLPGAWAARAPVEGITGEALSALLGDLPALPERERVPLRAESSPYPDSVSCVASASTAEGDCAYGRHGALGRLVSTLQQQRDAYLSTRALMPEPTRWSTPYSAAHLEEVARVTANLERCLRRDGQLASTIDACATASPADACEVCKLPDTCSATSFDTSKYHVLPSIYGAQRTPLDEAKTYTTRDDQPVTGPPTAEALCTLTRVIGPLDSSRASVVLDRQLRGGARRWTLTATDGAQGTMRCVPNTRLGMEALSVADASISLDGLDQREVVELGGGGHRVISGVTGRFDGLSAAVRVTPRSTTLEAPHGELGVRLQTLYAAHRHSLSSVVLSQHHSLADPNASNLSVHRERGRTVGTAHLMHAGEGLCWLTAISGNLHTASDGVALHVGEDGWWTLTLSGGCASEGCATVRPVAATASCAPMPLTRYQTDLLPGHSQPAQTR